MLSNHWVFAVDGFIAEQLLYVYGFTVYRSLGLPDLCGFSLLKEYLFPDGVVYKEFGQHGEIPDAVIDIEKHGIEE